MCFTIPVQSIYEAALIRINLALTDLIKSEIGATPDYSNSFTLEVCLDEENDECLSGFRAGFKSLLSLSSAKVSGSSALTLRQYVCVIAWRSVLASAEGSW